MKSNRFKLYIEQNKQLIKTIVIKNSYIANHINDYTALMYGEQHVDYNDPYSWKYYMNLSGELHFTDTKMYINSLDNGDTIEFNINNLNEHINTKIGYRYGSKYYNELVLKYPTQETLILGILYPTDIETLVSAKDFTIVNYPDYLVEEYEYSLINKLQSYVYGFFERWLNPQYITVNDLYLHTKVGIFYQTLLPMLINTRLEACKTNEAHSYHIKEYLASNGNLDKYYKQLTRSQALFLYRNINYIKRYAGRQDTFDWLIDNLLTKRSLPIGEYLLTQDMIDVPDKTLYPTTKFIKNNLTNIAPATFDTNITTLDMLTKERDICLGNAIYKNENITEINVLNNLSLSNVEKTKVLESSIIDKNALSPYTLVDVLINHWAFLSHKGIYNSTITIEHPKLDLPIILHAKDAFILMLYCLHSATGLTPIYVPPFIAKRVLRIPYTTKQELMGIIKKTKIEKTLIDFLYSEQPRINRLISIQSFYNLGDKIFNNTITEYKATFLQENSLDRAKMEMLCDRFYSDNPCYFFPKDNQKKYADWLIEKGIDLSVFELRDYRDLAENIIGAATGLDKYADNSLRKIQAAMLAIMKQLSSYSIQFVSELLDDGVIASNISAVRPTEFKIKSYDKIELPIPLVNLVRNRVKGSHKVKPDTVILEVNKLALKGKDHLVTDATIHVKLNREKLTTKYIEPTVSIVNISTGIPLDKVIPPELFEMYINLEDVCSRNVNIPKPDVVDPNSIDNLDGLS